MVTGSIVSLHDRADPCVDGAERLRLDNLVRAGSRTPRCLAKDRWLLQQFAVKQHGYTIESWIRSFPRSTRRRSKTRLSAHAQPILPP